MTTDAFEWERAAHVPLEPPDVLPAFAGRICKQGGDWPCPTARLLAIESDARYAKAVATAWRDEVMANDTLRQTGMSHPLAMVLAAFGGEKEASQLGLSDAILRIALGEAE